MRYGKEHLEKPTVRNLRGIILDSNGFGVPGVTRGYRFILSGARGSTAISGFDVNDSFDVLVHGLNTPKATSGEDGGLLALRASQRCVYHRIRDCNRSSDHIARQCKHNWKNSENAKLNVEHIFYLSRELSVSKLHDSASSIGLVKQNEEFFFFTLVRINRGCYIRSWVASAAPDSSYSQLEPVNAMAEIKGILLNGWVKFLNDRYGEQAVTNALGALSPEDRRLVRAVFLDASWYPYDALHALGRLTRPLMTRAEKDIASEIGRFMAQYAFTGVYRSLLAHDPIKQVEKFISIGEFFFHEARKLETNITGPASCLVRYRYESGAKPTRSICTSLGGFWSRSIELAGASDVRASHPKCVAAGADCCEFVFEWKPPAS